MTKPADHKKLPDTDHEPIRLGRARGSLIVYRYTGDQLCFLLVSSRRRPDRLTLPGGKTRSDEDTRQAAIRETLEESGVYTAPNVHSLDQYLHRKRGPRIHPTDTYLGYYAGRITPREPREIYWLSLEDIESSQRNIPKPIRKQLRQAAQAIRDRAVRVG